MAKMSQQLNQKPGTIARRRSRVGQVGNPSPARMKIHAETQRRGGFHSKIEHPRPKRLLRFAIRLVAAALVTGVLSILLPRLVTALHARPRLFSVASVPPRRVAIVFGAGVRDGRPTPQLRDRVATAAALYFAGKVEKLLMSGDNRFIDYNEPAAMQKYALSLGVPYEDIVLDYAGRRTYDTCYRARDIFQVQDVILVTQSYHLPRALYLCNRMGVNAIGVPAERDNAPYTYWKLRELPATLVALWEVHIAHPVPVLGEPEPIFPSSVRSLH